MAAFDFLTGLSLLLLVGIILSYAAKRFSMSNVLVLMFAGYLISFVKVSGQQIISFSNEFLEAVAIIALIMIVFDSTSRFHLRRLNKDAALALKVSTLFVIVELVVISFATFFLFGTTLTFSILFAAIMTGTDAGSALSLLQGLNHRVISFLEIESLVNTPLTVILPFIVLDFASNINISTLVETSIEQVTPFLQQIVTGVGAGIVVALIVLRVIRKQYSEILSPVTLISSALLTYILAESLGGNGVLAVTTFGLFFGNVYIEKKETLKTFGSLFSNLFEILVFLLLGLSLTFPVQMAFYAKALLLFVIYLILRGFVIWVVFRKRYTNPELIFTTLNSPKGVAVAVVIFTLLSQNLASQLFVHLSIIFIVYSVLLSTVVVAFSHKFLGVKMKKNI